MGVRVLGVGYWGGGTREEGVLGGRWQSEYLRPMLVQFFMQGSCTSQCADSVVNVWFRSFLFLSLGAK